MRLRLAQQPPEEIDMTPMIDIVFQLIIFFMIASSFVEEAKVYKVTVPKAEMPETISTEEARTISVTKDGDVAPADATEDKDKYASLLDLVDELKTYKAEREKNGAEAVVVIAGDKDASYARVIQVWNAIRNAGIQQVSFQVEPGTPDEK